MIEKDLFQECKDDVDVTPTDNVIHHIQNKG